ncbi:MAG: ABC transporter substrate-binding protein, partial [Thermomonas sp.]
MLLLAAVFLMLPVACSSTYQKPLTIGTNVWTGNEPLYLARSLGYYDERRLRLVELSSSAQSMDALRAGRLDAASLTLDEALTLAAEGVPLRVVWVLD